MTRRGMMMLAQESEPNVIEWNQGEPLPEGCELFRGDNLAVAEISSSGEIHLKCSTSKTWNDGAALVNLPQKYQGVPMKSFEITTRITTAGSMSETDIIAFVVAPTRRILLFLQKSNEALIQYGLANGTFKQVTVTSYLGSFLNKNTKFGLVYSSEENKIDLLVNDVLKYTLYSSYGRDVGITTKMFGCLRNTNVCEMYVSHFRVEFV